MRVLIAILVLMCAGFASQPERRADRDAESLVGTWTVDLRPTPDAPAYYQEFVVERIDGKTFTGRFYGTEIENGRINTDWGKVHFAFTTADGSGSYNTSGVLEGNQLRGTTHSIGRKFLSVWTAEKKK